MVATHITLNHNSELRRFHTEDAQALHEAIAVSTAELAPWLAWCTQPVQLEDQQSFIARALRKWHEEQLAGAASILGGPNDHTRELGYWIATPHTGKRLATMAARALTREAFRLEGVDTVQICCDPANHPSQAVARRAGYRLERVDEVEIIAPGETGHEMVWMYP